MKLRMLTAMLLGLVYSQISTADVTVPATNTTPAQVPTQATAAPATKQVVQVPPATTINNVAPASVSVTAPAASTTTISVAPTVSPVLLTTDEQKISYSIGADLGNNFKAQNIVVDPVALSNGIRDAMAGSQLAMTPEQINDTLMAFQKKLIAQQQARFASTSAKNQQEGDAFLEANKKNPGVLTTASGLEYKVITQGKGTSPKDTDTVTVDYSGSFLNGQVFDSSYQRGKPVTFAVSEVIPGWTEALKLMQPGSVFEVVVPSKLAYGERGLGNVIGPNQTLVFKIHLIGIKGDTQTQSNTQQNTKKS